MVQNRPILDIVSHLVLMIGILIVALPIWITFVAATHDPLRMTQAPIPLLPGLSLIHISEPTRPS